VKLKTHACEWIWDEEGREANDDGWKRSRLIVDSLLLTANKNLAVLIMNLVTFKSKSH
jgi:hypothetical protein